MPPNQNGPNTALSVSIGGRSNVKQRPKSSAPNSNQNRKNGNYIAE